MKTLYIHPGIAKCATTLLQKHVFPSIQAEEEIDYLGRYYNPDNSYTFKGASEILQDMSVQRIGNAKFKLLKTYFDDSDKDKFIFSSESIIKPFPGNSFRDNAEGLLDIIDVKFVVSFRNPVDLVISRFIHDKNVIQHERRIAEVIHFSGECSYPICRTSIQSRLFSCKCESGKYKKIFANLYSITYLKEVFFEGFSVEYFEIIQANGRINSTAMSNLYQMFGVSISETAIFPKVNASTKADSYEDQKTEIAKILNKSKWY